jgi:DNA-binding transcriptional ArsR family regulator
MTTLVDDDLWEAIADPTRRRLLDSLVVDGDASASALTTGVSISRQAVTKHLGVLERVGLVAPHRAGREVRYRVQHARLTEATHALASVADRWDERLAAIKRLAEAAERAETESGG